MQKFEKFRHNKQKIDQNIFSLTSEMDNTLYMEPLESDFSRFHPFLLISMNLLNYPIATGYFFVQVY